MTRTPEFDELVDDDVERSERERLRRVHDLLVAAGPPPELSPELEAGPDMAVTYRHRRRRPGVARRSALLAAAALGIVGAFLLGYMSGNSSKTPQAFPAVKTITMHGTKAAPDAHAALRLGDPDSGGNWPMRIVATGLPTLPKGGYYLLVLTRHGKIVGPCGTFVVHKGRVVTYLNAPYRIGGAGWIVTKQMKGDRKPGPVVLTT